MPGFASDRLLVSGFTSDSVTRYDAATGQYFEAFANGGQDGVLGVALGPDGALYVCCEESNSVKRFDANGNYLGDFIRNDPATPEDETGGLAGPAGIVFGPNEHAYVGSFDNSSILEYDARTGAFVRFLVLPGGGGLNGPDAGLTIGPDNNLYVPSFFSNRVKQYSLADGTLLSNWITPATAPISRPRTIVFRGSSVYVTCEANDRVIECRADTGAFLRNIVWNDPATPQDDTGGLDGPTGLAFGPDGLMYVASIQTNSVLRYNGTTGAFVDVFVPAGVSPMIAPTYVLFRPEAENYGPVTPNSVGAGATLTVEGFSSAAAQQLVLDMHFARQNQLALFRFGTGRTQFPLGDGNGLIVPTTIRRLGIAVTNTVGHARHVVNFAAVNASRQPFLPGAARCFQVLVRDPGGTGFNLTDAVEVQFDL